MFTRKNLTKEAISLLKATPKQQLLMGKLKRNINTKVMK